MDEWAGNIRKLVAILKVSARTIITEESISALELAIRLTPPKTHSEGKKAVARDIQRTMRPLVAADITEDKTLRRVVREGDITKFNEQAKYIQGGTLGKLRAVQFNPAEHIRYRDKRGRVVSDHHQVVLGQSEKTRLKDYIKLVQIRVGWAKGGWAGAMMKLGGSAPSDWIGRHSHAASGQLIDGRKDPEGPTVSVINKTAWARGGVEARRIVNNVTRIRARKMENRIKYMMRESAAKSGATVLG